MTGQEIDYNALSETLLGDSHVHADQAPLRGDAAAAGHALLLAEYGNDRTINQAIRTGRPVSGTPNAALPRSFVAAWPITTMLR